MGGAMRERWGRCNRMCYLAECSHHLCTTILNEARRNIMQMSFNGAIRTPPSSSSLFPRLPALSLCPRQCPIYLVSLSSPSSSPHILNSSSCLHHQPIFITPFSFSESENVSLISTSDTLADQKTNMALVM